jgi:hypothetical protein
MSSHPATRAYVDRRIKEGLSKKEIIRCLKRYVARRGLPPPQRRRLTPADPWDELTEFHHSSFSYTRGSALAAA